MVNPSAFTLESVREFMVDKGGKVTNHDLVRHFKFFLTDPRYKENARVQFKEFVNALATIKVEDGEKYLVLKRMYRSDSISDLSTPAPTSPLSNTLEPAVSGRTPPPYRPPPYRPPPPPACPPTPLQTIPRFHPFPPGVRPALLSSASLRGPSARAHSPPSPYQGAPFRPVPAPRSHESCSPDGGASPQSYGLPSPNWADPQPVGLPSPSSPYHLPLGLPVLTRTDPQSLCQPLLGSADPQPLGLPPPPGGAPVPPPRRHQSLDERRLSYCEREGTQLNGRDETDSDGGSSQKKVSVREHAQLFNRIASETQLLLPGREKRLVKPNKPLTEDDDTASTATTEAFYKEWCLVSSSANYMDLLRLLKDNPRLAKQKDFITGYTALHWAAKHGNLDAIKLLAGTHAVDVHTRTRGGYTALHVALLFGHEDAADLLVHTYGADPNIRDYSGKKPRQYQTREETTLSTEAFRKMKKRKTIERDSASFLRIGSLNVRVKRTTVALNSLLSGAAQNSGLDRHRRSWSNASEGESMPPPATARRSVRKRKSRRGQDFEALKSRISAPILNSPSSAAAAAHSLGGSLSDLRRHSTASEPTPSPLLAPAHRHSAASIDQQPQRKPTINSDSDSEYGFGQNWTG